ncbi:MAG: septum formation initiator family protein [Lachnospiraceae bacterium]|nr:septum formation initiator family protein [Lachnospiraceae bacterium]
MRRREKRATGLGLLIVLTFILCGVLLYASAGLRRERDNKLETKAALERQIAEQELMSKKLDAKKDYTGTRKFIEEMARKVLGLVYPDETVFEEK